jgi:hypothetical protein
METTLLLFVAQVLEFCDFHLVGILLTVAQFYTHSFEVSRIEVFVPTGGLYIFICLPSAMSLLACVDCRFLPR